MEDVALAIHGGKAKSDRYTALTAGVTKEPGQRLTEDQEIQAMSKLASDLGGAQGAAMKKRMDFLAQIKRLGLKTE